MIEERATPFLPNLCKRRERWELSGLAWDHDESLLYAVSDRGLIHHFLIRLDGTPIAELKLIFSGRLSAPGVGSRALSNAEGLDVLNSANGQRSDTELLIALEDGPAIARFTPHGQYIASMKLQGPLADRSSYRRGDKGLESVAMHPRYGFVTAPERPLLSRPTDIHTIFAADGRTVWSFEAFQKKHTSLKAIEALPDGSLLILERTDDKETNVSQVRLRHVDLANCTAAGLCAATDASVLSGEIPPGNYEGLSRLSDELFLIVSDHTKRDRRPARLVLFRYKVKS